MGVVIASEPVRAGGRSIAALRSPWRIAAAITFVYLLVVAGALAHHHPAQDFAFVGRTFVTRSATSEAIARHAQPTSPGGYDGQFALYIALDPAHAAPSIDKPLYRYSHVLYPVLARALALGNDAWVAAALIAVNLLALFFGTLALALILVRQGQPPALAALFGFFPGVFVAFERDSGDLLAYSLVAVGILALRWDAPRRVALAGLAFGAAGLARESALLFPAVLVAAHLLSADDGRAARVRRAAVVSLAAVGPYVALRIGLRAWLGAGPGTPGGLARFPFAGIALQRWDLSAVVDAATVVAPALLLAFVAVRSVQARRPNPFLVLLGLQLAVFVVFLPRESYADYYAAGRLQIGTVVAALCAVPVLRSAAASPVALKTAVALAMAPGLLFALFSVSGYVPL